MSVASNAFRNEVTGRPQVVSPGSVEEFQTPVEGPNPSKPVDVAAEDLAAKFYKATLRTEVMIRALRPAALTILRGIPTLEAGASQPYQFQIDDTYVPVFAISIVNSTAATQYFNVESPASVLTMPIAAGAVFTYNLTQVKRIYLYSAAGTTVYPFPGQNVGEGTTGLYVQAWSNLEWKNMKGQNA